MKGIENGFKGRYLFSWNVMVGDGILLDMSRLTSSAGVPILLFLAIIGHSRSNALEFVKVDGSRLFSGSDRFYAIGVNCYFLREILMQGREAEAWEIFSEAKRLGVTTIRTWGFSDGSSSTAIQTAPGEFDQDALVAFDRLLVLAAEFEIRLVIPLVNNWEDFGGMNQYVRWLAERQPRAVNRIDASAQRTIIGPEGRSYRFMVDGSFTHDDFYSDSTIRSWYKQYITAILTRVNSVTGKTYRDDPAILAWELANEPRSSDRSGMIVTGWLELMAAHVKSIDANHLLGSGEEGFDTWAEPYGDSRRYNGQDWMLDGSAGISFLNNLRLANIDLAGIHCYPSAWGLTLNQGLTWLRDHRRLAEAIGKPFIAGEVGERRSREAFYASFIDEASPSGVLLWQFTYDHRPDNDGYAFTYPDDANVCSILSDAARRYRERTDGTFLPPDDSDLLQNFPNPFNAVSSVRYTLSQDANATLDLYDMVGERLLVITEGMRPAGIHHSLVDATAWSSGMYLLRLKVDGEMYVRKILVVR